MKAPFRPWLCLLCKWWRSLFTLSGGAHCLDVVSSLRVITVPYDAFAGALSGEVFGISAGHTALEQSADGVCIGEAVGTPLFFPAALAPTFSAQHVVVLWEINKHTHLLPMLMMVFGDIAASAAAVALFSSA